MCSTATPPCAIFSMDPGLRSDGAATLLAAALLEGPDAENPHTHAAGKSAMERKNFMLETPMHRRKGGPWDGIKIM